MDSLSGINSKVFVRSILGEKVVCTLSDGQTASGRLICVDRLKNLILSDCVCEQNICSSDYVPPKPTDEMSKQLQVSYQTVTRYLQQAMVPGNHIESIRLCDRVVYDTAYKASTIASNNVGYDG